jgi:hypothetical protein
MTPITASPEILAKSRSYTAQARIPIGYEAWLMCERHVRIQDVEYVIPAGRMVQVLGYMNAGFRGIEATCVGTSTSGQDVRFHVCAGWLVRVVTA